MTVFADAVDVLFDDPNMGRDALWRQGGGGSAVPVRAIVRAPDAGVSFGEARGVIRAVELMLRVSEIPDPAAGDTVEIDGTVYELRGAPMRDPLRLVWTAEAREM